LFFMGFSFLGELVAFGKRDAFYCRLVGQPLVLS
jgi:hypothetical protein